MKRGSARGKGMDKSLARRIEAGVKQKPSFGTEDWCSGPLMAKDDLAVRTGRLLQEP